MTKDWTGNSVTYSKVSGFSNHTDNERQVDDYYATEPLAVRLLLEMESFGNNIRECACGEGHLSEEIKKFDKVVTSSDIIDRGYGSVCDFLGTSAEDVSRLDIITNPPYKFADLFIKKGLEVLKDGGKMALFLPIRYLEGKARKKIFTETPPYKVYVSSSRLKCAMNGEFDKMTGSAVCYAWFIRIKGFNGETTLKRFN